MTNDGKLIKTPKDQLVGRPGLEKGRKTNLRVTLRAFERAKRTFCDSSGCSLLADSTSARSAARRIMSRQTGDIAARSCQMNLALTQGAQANTAWAPFRSTRVNCYPQATLMLIRQELT